MLNKHTIHYNRRENTYNEILIRRLYGCNKSLKQHKVTFENGGV